MKKSSIVFVLSLALVAVFALVPDMALAQSSGSANTGNSLLQDVTGLFTGNIGTIVGLGLSLFGLWMWLVQQSSWGLIILIGGAALTAFPGIFKSVNEGVKSALGTTVTTPSQAR